MADPTITWEPINVRQLLLGLAALARTMILQRAFPGDGSPTRDRRGQAVRPLQQDYAWYKSGTRPYRSQLTRALALSRRAASGKPGPGPLVNVLGIRTRLGPRFPVANQRLTDGTARGLGVIRETENQVVLGFRDARSQRVAGHLERRNRFWGLAPDESARLNVIVEQRVRELARSVRIDPSRIRVTVRF